MTVPLHLLHTFVVVARSGSMKAAAGNLNVTPGAVSQRIRELEERSGMRLFARTGSGVELTAAGQRLFDKLEPAFRAIEAAQVGLRKSRRRLTVNLAPTFASHWLIPRLGRFAERHPNIEIAIETDTRLVDLHREPVDIAVRHGLGQYPGLKSIWLLAPKLVVVASPALLEDGPPLREPRDCLGYPLLQDSGRHDWRLWLAAQGVDSERANQGPAFSDDHLLVRAAVASQGLALVRDFSAEEELRAGRLVAPLDVAWPSTFAYYLVGTPNSFARPDVRHFAAWLTGEAGVPQDFVDGSRRESVGSR